MSHRPSFDPDAPEYANDDPTWGDVKPDPWLAEEIDGEDDE